MEGRNGTLIQVGFHAETAVSGYDLDIACPHPNFLRLMLRLYVLPWRRSLPLPPDWVLRFDS
jgi:hypothetical protein